MLEMALQIWREAIPDLKAVIVDGSGYIFPERLSNEYTEIISYQRDMRQNYLGKGYGEVLDIEMALLKSDFIRESDKFMKITSKYWIHNIKQLRHDMENIDELRILPVFSPLLRLLYVNTAFFASRRSFFLERVIPILKETVDDNIHHHDLEHAMVHVIINNCTRCPFLTSIPILEGWSGTSDNLVSLKPNKAMSTYYNFKVRLGTYFYMFHRMLDRLK